MKFNTRVRYLDNWAFCGIMTNDGKTWIYTLTGQVIKETKKTNAPARFTNTSPIVAYANGIATTISGCQYKLGSADPVYGCRKNQLTGDILNPWINK
jgi:hypothetical protein